TRSKRDWSSDVCSSDLNVPSERSRIVSLYTETILISFVSLFRLATIMQSVRFPSPRLPSLESTPKRATFVYPSPRSISAFCWRRSEERRVGKESGARGG